MRYKINFSNFDRAKELRKRFINKTFWIAVVFSIILGFYGINKFLSLGKEVEKVLGEANELKEKIEKATQERKRILSEKEELTLKNKIRFYEDLQRKKLTQTIFFNILEEKTPNNIKLVSVDVDVMRKSFIINGETLFPEMVGVYLGELQKVEFFKNVTLVKQVMQKGVDEKIVIGNFEIRGEII